MKKLVLSEEFESTEDAGTIHVRKQILNISEGKGFRAVVDSSIDKDTDCGGTDAVMLQ